MILGLPGISAGWWIMRIILSKLGAGPSFAILVPPKQQWQHKVFATLNCSLSHYLLDGDIEGEAKC